MYLLSIRITQYRDWATAWAAKECGLIIGRGEFFSSLKCPEVFFGLQTLLSGYREPFHRVSSVQGVKQTTNFQPVPILRMTGAIHLHTSYAFMLSTGTNLPLPHIVSDGYKSGLIYSVYFIYLFINNQSVTIYLGTCQKISLTVNNC